MPAAGAGEHGTAMAIGSAGHPRAAAISDLRDGAIGLACDGSERHGFSRKRHDGGSGNKCDANEVFHDRSFHFQCEAGIGFASHPTLRGYEFQHEHGLNKFWRGGGTWILVSPPTPEKRKAVTLPPGFKPV